MMTSFRTQILVGTLAGAGLLGASVPAHAWIYPEHRDIAVLAVDKLDAERRALFDRLWGEARAGHEQRLCALAADSQQSVAPTCIDWAAMPAIAGDHSCSSKGMLDTVLTTDWILQVADVAAQLKLDLGRIAVTAPTEINVRSKDIVGDVQRLIEDEARRAARVNALRTSDTRLQRADPEYATRAGSNNAHFLIPRPRTSTTPREYAQLTLTPGSDLNALGVYGWFHISALQKATRLAAEQLAPAERTALARSMLADEAFALHFLEDAYAAGHVAGAWGDVSQRKGTHDYYNEAGLEVFTWSGGSESVVLMGDAHMRPEDADRASTAVRISLEQLIDHAAGRERPNRLPHTAAAPSDADGFDVCKTNVFPTPRASSARHTRGHCAGARSARPDAGTRSRARAGIDAALSRRGGAVHRLRRLRRRAHDQRRVHPRGHLRWGNLRRRPLAACWPWPGRRDRRVGRRAGLRVARGAR